MACMIIILCNEITEKEMEICFINYDFLSQGKNNVYYVGRTTLFPVKYQAHTSVVLYRYR